MATIIVRSGDNLQTAINDASAGDTLRIRTGTFSGVFTASELVLENYPSEIPTITSPTNDSVLTVSDCTLHGLNIVGTHDLGEGDHFDDVSIMITGTDLVTVEYCTFSKYGHCAVKSMWDATPLLLQYCEINGGGWTNLDNAIYIGTENSGTKTIRYNHITGAMGAAIQFYNDEEFGEIYGNVIDHNGWGIILTGHDHKIYYNTIFDNAAYGIELFHYDLHNLDIRNNICWNNGEDMNAQLSEGENVTNLIKGYNCFGTTGHEEIFSDPSDVRINPRTLGSTNWQDYRLADDSPCRGAGVAIAGISGLDPNYSTLMARVAGNDIGAFVYSNPQVDQRLNQGDQQALNQGDRQGFNQVDQC